MKKRLCLAITMVAMIIATVAIVLTVGSKAQSATVFVATDTHYLSSRVNDKGKAFWDMMDMSDGKLVQYCDEIISAFTDDVIEQKPDVLIISGDLSLNGEKASHEDLIKKLKYIQDSGVQVLTVSGNHDINRSACGYSGDEYIRVDNVDADEFRNLYFDFGMKQAESVDEHSQSYLYKVNKDLYILMLDTNAFGQNFVQDESYPWIESQLKYVKKMGAQVITVSHQNLFAHNEMISFGYQLYDADELLALYNKYEVECNLSGHIHTQHTMRDGVTEIVTSSLLVAPVQYGVINFDGDIDYSTKRVDVPAWARRNGIDDKNLLSFDTYATEFFAQSGINKALAQVDNSTLTADELKLIADAFSKLNGGYFAGQTVDTDSIAQGIDLVTNDDGFMKKYFDIMMEEAKLDHNSAYIQRR